MATAPDTHFLSLQEALAGRYSLERELGRGGMGIVYLAHEVALDRPVALKLLPAHLAAMPALRERFLREARTAAKLSHPHIVPIFSVDQVRDFVFFAMAYVNGETLGQRIRGRGPLPASDAARILREVAWALAYAHAQGVIHRDVKPDNILLETPTGRALVSDFGIAAVGAGGAEAAGAVVVAEAAGVGLTAGVIGTPEFMSPEQATGEPVDGRSDLYALGCVGYYMLSGRVPFDGPTVPAVLAKHVAQPHAPLASAAPEAPARLARVIDRCLAKSRDQRFENGEALADALAQGAEARKELPVPLRIFLKRSRETYQSIVPFALFGFVFVVPYVGMVLAGAGTGAFGWAGAGIGLLSAPLISLLYQARKLAKAGYGLADLRLAVREELAQKEEELRFEFGARPSRVERVARPVMWMSAVTGGLTALAAALAPALMAAADPWRVVTFCGIAFVGSGIVVARSDARRKDVWGKRALKFWQSRVGAWFHRLATKGAAHGLPAAGAAHHPTELAIGLAADRLYEQLPKPVRAQLADVPQVVRRLEADAQVMRARIEEVNALLAEAGDGRTAQAADRRAALRDRLERERTEAETQLRDTVTALETVRLNLLRMHAGVGTIASVTADLESAREVSAAVSRLAEGQREVESLLAPGSRPG
jgi:serine/threonine-protein kinase